MSDGDRVHIAGPWVTQKEVDYVADAARNGWYGQANSYLERFETAFAAYVGVPYAIALPSCTSAIHLSLLALGVGEGDEVIVPDLTWIASAAPISYVGATPVFADVDERSWCLAAEAVEGLVTARTKAVIAVDLYGGLPEMDRLRAVTGRHGLPLIEDAAEAIGSEYRGRRAGSFGDTGVFSFHGSKTMTTGEGGMLVTEREDLYRRSLFLRDHGREPGDVSFRNTEVAYKYRMSGLQAAFGLAQLERIEELVGRKREIYGWYAAELDGVEGVRLNREAPGTKNSYWMVTLLLDEGRGMTKETVMEKLAARHIDSRPMFHPLSSLPAYEGRSQAAAAAGRNVVSYRISPYGLNLPSGLNLDRATVRRVCEALKEIL